GVVAAGGHVVGGGGCAPGQGEEEAAGEGAGTQSAHGVSFRLPELCRRRGGLGGPRPRFPRGPPVSSWGSGAAARGTRPRRGGRDGGRTACPHRPPARPRPRRACAACRGG